jgi:hypothetical protein
VKLATTRDEITHPGESQRRTVAGSPSLDDDSLLDEATTGSPA